MELNDLRLDLARRQKKGLHFILASVFIWTLILIAQLVDASLWQQNMLVFVASAALIPFSLLASRLIHVDFQIKDNPLAGLALLASLNQLAYILIAMWAFAEAPEKMLMVYAMIFGAHMMPFSWLYRSRTYLVMSILIPVVALVLGVLLPRFVLAIFMVVVEVVFACCLHQECKKL